MMPSFIILPKEDLSLSIIPLQSNWQIPGLFLTPLLCGPKIGTISAISYLIIGLFYLPVFHGGGSVGYIVTHEFGYLLGFIPAAWTCGYLVKKNSKANLLLSKPFTHNEIFSWRKSIPTSSFAIFEDRRSYLNIKTA